MNNEEIKNLIDTRDIPQEVLEEIIKEIQNTETKKLIIETEEITPEQRMSLEAMKRVKNPFAMLTVKDIMRDLNICETVAYRTFKREDFPSINVGKTNQVMLLPYLLWKMTKKV